MPVIPSKARRLVESKLRDRWVMVARAKAALFEAQAAAVSASAPAMDAVRVSSGPGDRTRAAALRILEAEEKLRQAEAWQEVFRLADAALPFESTPEGVVAGYLWGNGMSIEECCRATGRKRTTICHLRDNYVAHCALFAAAAGLIRFGEGGKD